MGAERMADWDWRYEIKLTAPESEHARVLSWVRAHAAGLGWAYPPREIRNVYFDTYDWESVAEHRAGVAERAKLRLRWYGSGWRVGQSRLELKLKRGMLGTKRYVGLDAGLDLTRMGWREIMRRLHETGDATARGWLCAMAAPALINTYRREYFVSADGAVRLTVDTDIALYAQGLSGRPNLRRRLLREPALVVEVKADAAQWARVREVVSALPLRPFAYSKYAHGMMDYSISG